jgi:hypothetical protein
MQDDKVDEKSTGLESVAVEQLALLLKALPANNWRCCWRALPLTTTTTTRMEERYPWVPTPHQASEHDDAL